MIELPDQVRQAYDVVEHASSDSAHQQRRREVLDVLTTIPVEGVMITAPDIEYLWEKIQRLVEKSERPEPYWVLWFADAVIAAWNQPKYAYLSQIERDELLAKVTKASKAIKDACNKGLEARLVTANACLHRPRNAAWKLELRGGFIYETLSDFDKDTVDNEDYPLLTFSEALTLFEKYSAELLEERRLEGGKADDNTQIVRFIRSLSRHNRWHYGHPLTRVVSIAASLCFSKSISEGRVSKNLPPSERKNLTNVGGTT